jgi:hypothetical protein
MANAFQVLVLDEQDLLNLRIVEELSWHEI